MNNSRALIWRCETEKTCKNVDLRNYVWCILNVPEDFKYVLKKISWKFDIESEENQENCKLSSEAFTSA